MNKTLKLAVAAALVAGASSANAGIEIPAGDWTVNIGGNVNAYYTHTSFGGDFDTDGSGTYGTDDANTVQTGLLPSAFGIGAKTRQNDLDVAWQITYFVGGDSGSGSAFGNNSLNVRQAYLTFGDASWGTIKLGRDLGLFASDAILSDMTLLGVGHGAGLGGTTTLGRIGAGYQYADWKGQISYASPNWNGFTFAAGITEGLNNATDSSNNNLGYEAKVGYEWAGDMPGKVWAGYIHAKHEDLEVAGVELADGYTTDGFDVGAKVSMGGFGLVGYYYTGDGLSGADAGPGNLKLNGGVSFLSGSETDDDGGYIQATYTIPGPNTKIGLSYGVSKSEEENGSGEIESSSWVLGAYHPITKHLNLVAEYTDHEYENDQGAADFDGDAKTIALGAIIFF